MSIAHSIICSPKREDETCVRCDYLYGYPIEGLVIVAELLRRKHITESDLLEIRDNLKLAYQVIQEEQRERTKELFAQFHEECGIGDVYEV